MFYKITKSKAELIGAFEYDSNKIFSPFVGEQTDGCYIVSEIMYDILKDTEQFKRIDWSLCPKLSKEQLLPKIK